jgi:hypothetical protein
MVCPRNYNYPLSDALIIFNYPGDLAAASGAHAPEHLHARLDVSTDIADAGHLLALHTPHIIENFEADASGDGLPDLFSPWGKIVIDFILHIVKKGIKC